MPARFTDAGADLMMKQIAQDKNPFYMDGDQTFMRFDALVLTIKHNVGAVVEFHWKRKAIYSMTAENYFGTYGDSLTISVTGQMAVHFTN